MKSIDKNFGCRDSPDIFCKDVFLRTLDTAAEKYLRRDNGTAACNVLAYSVRIFYAETLTKRVKNYIIICE